MGWEKEENYAKKRDLEEYTKKNTFNKKVTEIESSLETKITKDDLPDHSIYLQQKDLELYAKKGDLPKIPDHSIYALKKDIPVINMDDYIKKSEINNIFAKNVGHNDLNVKLKKLDHRWTNV